MKTNADLGMNRTGIGLAPRLSAEAIEGAKQGMPVPDGEDGLYAVRFQYTNQSEPVGSMPPPSSLKGMAKATMQMLTGHKPTIFLDKLGERLAFERTGTRLYQSLLTKFDALGGWEGGPERADLVAIQQDEMRHFEMVREAIESLGADPTVMTPCADLAGVESMGVVQALADPRTTLAQGLHAILVAELVDNDGWEMLITLARDLKHDALATRFQTAFQAEQRHLMRVRGWLTTMVAAEANREQKLQTP